MTADPCPKTTSNWAATKLNFYPSPKQSEVLNTEAKYLILCCKRQWGKTTTIAIKALHHATEKPDQTIVISRTKHQAAILINRATRFLPRLNIKLRRVLGFPFSLELPNGTNIIAVAHSGNTSVGNTANVLIVDEAALVQDNVYSAVSASIARIRGAIWLMSTPCRQAGFFFNIWHTPDKRWTKIFSPVTDCPEIDPDYLEMQKAADPIRYRQDFLCAFTQPPDRLVTMEMINRLMHTDIDQWYFPPLFHDHVPAPGTPTDVK